MGFFKCCVGGCNATSETHRLFLFSLPKDDTLRNVWMSFLVPTNSLLIGLSKEQLLRRRVCEKHFDTQQFDYQGKRLRLSYPCLLTDTEIAHGVPLPSPGTVHNALSDHSYQLIMDEDDDDDDTNSTLVIGRAGENFQEHPSCSNSQPISSIKEGQRAMNLKPIQVEIQTKEDKKCPTQNCQDSMMKELGSRKKKFIKHVTKIASESLGQTAQRRLEKAAVYGNNEQLFKLFNQTSTNILNDYTSSKLSKC